MKLRMKAVDYRGRPLEREPYYNVHGAGCTNGEINRRIYTRVTWMVGVAYASVEIMYKIDELLRV